VIDEAARRQEALWRGDFGDQYLERNRGAGASREPFWRALYATHPFDSVLPPPHCRSASSSLTTYS